jgi:hypothetical protein
MRAANLRWTAVTLVTSVLAVQGCADVLGIDHFTVLDAGGGDGSIDQPSSDASVPSDATTADTTTAETGPDSTTASDAGSMDEMADDGGPGAGDSAPPPSCLGGGPCSPGTCQIGQYACEDGGLVCASQMAMNGTLCGGEAGPATAVCNGGTCKPCDTGGDCSTPNSCKKRVTVCSTGSAVCTDAGNADEGTTCGANMYCYGGVCSACKVSAGCPVANLCHLGTVSSCTGGVAACTDTGTAAANGTTCGTNKVCGGGTCVGCTANVACPLANPCHVGMTSCATGTSVCVDTGTNQSPGTLCTGTNKCNQSYSCQGGVCTGSNPVTCKALDQCHVVGTCDMTTGACSNPLPTAPTSCTGTDKCNQTYMCQSGTCTGSNPVTCTGGMTCVGGACECAGGTTNCGGTCTNTGGTDATNCGRCGHGCLTGGTCAAGACQPIPFVTTGTSNIVDFATDGTVVVFADTGNSEIAQVSIPGGTPLVLAGNGAAGTPDHVIIDAASGTVYWTSGANYGVASRGQLNSGNIASDANTCGGTTRALANPAASSFDILGAALYSIAVGTGCLADTTTGISGSLGASLSPQWVFGDIGNGVVVFGGNNNGPPNATVPNQAGVNWVADDGTNAYWATSDPAIRRAALAAPSGVSNLVTSPGSVTGLATDGTNVYYATSTGVFYAPVGGSVTSGTLLANKAATLVRYASGAVYFLSGETIYKIATP